MNNERKCNICGGSLPPRRQRYCCDACAAAARRKRAAAEYKPVGKSPMFREKICPDCGKEYVGHIKSRRCRMCQSVADAAHDEEYRKRKARGHVRPIGSIDTCVICGSSYEVRGSLQRYCASCAPVANRQWHAKKTQEYYANPKNAEKKQQSRKRQPQQYKCQVCEKNFTSNFFALVCSPECRQMHRRAYMDVYDERRVESKRAYNRYRWESLGQSEKAEINRKAREAYRRRKNEKCEGED